MGAPGGGKGTISKMILKDFNAIKHISTGDLIREQINDESSSIGKKVKDVVNSGGLVSDDLVLDVLKHSLNGQNDIFHEKHPQYPFYSLPFKGESNYKANYTEE